MFFPIPAKNIFPVLLLRFDQIPNIKLKWMSSSTKFKLQRQKFILSTGNVIRRKYKWLVLK